MQRKGKLLSLAKFTKIIGEASEEDFIGHNIIARLPADANVNVEPRSRPGSGQSEPISTEEESEFPSVERPS